MTQHLTIISLGAGVQSTTMALMAAHGEITPMPDCAIFADTGAEPHGVYKHLDWLETVLPFPVHRVMKREGFTRHIEQAGRDTRFATAPFYTGRSGMLIRQCTKEFKVEPIVAKVRELVGIKPRSPGPKEVMAEQWIGISMDEALRMKPSGKRYIRHRWPLIEMQINRRQCLAWMADHGYPEPRKSACVFCPYHSNEQWRELRDQAPEDWTEALRIDRLIRSKPMRGIKEGLYLHAQRVPLDQVDLSTAEDRGQLNLFLNECEGMCGV